MVWPTVSRKFLVGGGIGYELTPALELRVGYLMLNFEREIHTDDFDYDGDFELGGADVVVDWYPFDNAFRLSGGMIFSRNRIDLDAQLEERVTIGGVEYAIDDLAEMHGSVKFNSVTPYVGIGWGKVIGNRGRLHFIVDAGVQYYGSPHVTLHASCSQQGWSVAPTSCSRLDAAVEAEENDLNYQARDYKWYPVLNLGLVCRF